MAEKELIDVTLPNGSVLTNVPFGSTKDQVKNAAIKLGIAEVLDFKNDAQVKDPNMYRRDGSKKSTVGWLGPMKNEVTGGTMTEFSTDLGDGSGREIPTMVEGQSEEALAYMRKMPEGKGFDLSIPIEREIVGVARREANKLIDANKSQWFNDEEIPSIKDPEEDISWLEEFEFSYDSTHTDVGDWRLALDAMIPQTKLVIGGEDGLISVQTERERYGDEFANLEGYEARRDWLKNNRDQQVAEEHANVIAYQQQEGVSASAEILGNIAGTLSTPTSLAIVGRGISGAIKTGMLLGLETEAASQTVEGDLDVKDLAVSTAVGAAGGYIGNRLEKAARVVVGRSKVKKQEKALANLTEKANDELVDGAILGLTPKENLARARRKLSLNNEQMADLAGNNQVKFPTKNTVEKTIEARKNPIVSSNNFQRTMESIIAPLSTTVRNISQPVFGRLRKYEFNHHKNIHKNQEQASDFMRLSSKLAKGKSKQDYSKFETELANGNFTNAERIARESFPELLKPMQQVVGKDGILNNLHKMLNESGLKVKYRENYFPRKVKDYPGLRQALGKETQNKLDDLLNKEARKQGFETWRSLDNDTVSDLVNIYFSGNAGQGGQKIGLSKKRTIEEVSPELLNKFYYSAPESLNMYITTAVKEVEKRAFFGKKNIVQGFDNKIDIDQSIGNLVQEEKRLGNVSSEEVDDLRMLLKARFTLGEQAAGKIGAGARDLQTITLLGQFDSAAIQLSDIGASVYMNGFTNTIRSLVPAARGKTLSSAEELGILNNIAADINSHGAMSSVVDGVLKASGFKFVDRLGKDTFINAAHLKATKLADKNPRKLTEKWGDVFGEEMPELINDLKTGKMSDNVKLLMFNELSDIQPISLSEMPLKYLENPGGRILWSLKSFTLKQLDLVRREMIGEMANGNYTKGFTNAAKYAATMGIAGGTVQTIRDAFQTKELRPEVFPDKVLESLLGVFFLNRYTIESNLAKGDIGAYALGVVTPAAFNLGDEMGGLILETVKLANSDAETNPKVFEKATAKIPVGGKVGYYWLLGGAEAKLERERKKEERAYRKSIGIN